MQVQDMEKFSQVLHWVFSYYEKELTDLTFEMYWNGLKDYNIDEVQSAFNAHLQHPEDGKWWPKVSDIIKNCKGGTQDNALQAWHEVETAIRRVGGYQDVVFHDALIHQIIHKMGGWIALCDIADEKSFNFKSIEFQKSYRALYATPKQLQPPVELTGIINAQNAKIAGVKKKPPVLIGDAERAKQVMAKLQSPENLITIHRYIEKSLKTIKDNNQDVKA